MKIMVVVIILLLNGCVPMAAPTVDLETSRQQEALISQGVALMRAGAFNEAEAAFLMALDFGPSASATDGLGCVAFLKRDYARAEAHFIAALEQDPEYRGALSNLALLYEVSDRPQEARRLYRAALHSAPHHTRARNNYAALLVEEAERTGRPARAERDSAIRELRKAAALAAHPLVVSNIRSLEAP
jgi:Tfp pilus assembly protein PilF